MPSVASRASAAPCHSGTTYATGCIHAGSCSTGKKVPENRNIGTRPSRNTRLNVVSFSACAEIANIGAAYARVTSTTASSDTTPHADGTAPSAAATARNTTELSSERSTMAVRLPTTMSLTPIGVASMAWYWRCHLIAPSTGYDASKTPVCIAVAASTPGAMNCT